MARYTFDLRCLTETVFDGGCAVGQVRTVKYKQEPVAVLLGETGPPPADSTSTDGAISSSDTNPTLFRGRRPRWRPCRRPNFLEQLQSSAPTFFARSLRSPNAGSTSRKMYSFKRADWPNDEAANLPCKIFAVHCRLSNHTSTERNEEKGRDYSRPFAFARLYPTQTKTPVRNRRSCPARGNPHGRLFEKNDGSRGRPSLSLIVAVENCKLS